MESVVFPSDAELKEILGSTCAQKSFNKSRAFLTAWNGGKMPIRLAFINNGSLDCGEYTLIALSTDLTSKADLEKLNLK